MAGARRPGVGACRSDHVLNLVLIFSRPIDPTDCLCLSPTATRISAADGSSDTSCTSQGYRSVNWSWPSESRSAQSRSATRRPSPFNATAARGTEAGSSTSYDSAGWISHPDPTGFVVGLSGEPASVRQMTGLAPIKDDLWSRLCAARATVLAKVDGLSEYDLRRPMTSTGTNLLGLVKHLAGEEYGYLGEVFDRPAKVCPSWFREHPATEIDMWATPEESSSYIVEVYRQATAHADETIRSLDLDSPGVVPHWAGNGRTSLGSMLVLMVGETAQHAGHADIVRELIDGVVGTPKIDGGNNRLAQVQAAANPFR